jgi:hypothetical protein
MSGSKIGALAQYEVTFFGELLVFVEDELHKVILPTAVDVMLCLVKSNGIGFVILQPEIKVGEHEIDIVVLFSRNGGVDDGTEKSDFANIPEE